MNLRKSKTSKVMAGLIGFSMILSLFVGVGVQTASAALTQAQVDSIISLLQSFGADASTINNVRTSLTGGTPTGGGGTPSTGGFVFNNNLSLGMTHSDVLQLQLVLNADSATQVSTSGAGSPGNETNYFGTRTRAAVINFQAKYGISPQSGFVGPLTRQELNSMGGVVVLPPPPPPGTPLPPPVAGTGVTISAAAQPANSLAVINAARVPFTRFTLTAGSDGDVTVNSVTVERQGLATDGNFAGVVLLDEMGTQVGLAKTLNSNHQVILNEPLKIMRGSSKTYTVAVNMQDTNAEVNGGEIAAFAVINVNSAATVTGTLPIVGASH
ncbi:MAG TPA: peptidoglycan-binding protein, partial [Candidatus Paceibacterota bacterium]